MSVRQVPIRASISIGSGMVETPYVLSFNVHRRRGSPSTFDASIKVKGSVGGGTPTGGISISAGGEGVSHKIFTGVIKGAKVTPCWDDPSYVTITLTGDDALSLLQGKKYTKRVSGPSAGAFCLITGVARPGLKSGKFANSGTDNAFTIDSGNVVENSSGGSQGTNATLAGVSFAKAEGTNTNDLDVPISCSLEQT